MIIKIWKLAQIQELCGLQMEYKVPLEVIKFVKRQTATLDTEYGMGRDVDSDDGAMCFFYYRIRMMKVRSTDIWRC